MFSSTEFEAKKKCLAHENRACITMKDVFDGHCTVAGQVTA